jgi:hypothetical protein
VSQDDRSVKAEVVIASNREPIAASKFFDLHFPKKHPQNIVARNDSENVSGTANPISSQPTVVATLPLTVAQATVVPPAAGKVGMTENVQRPPSVLQVRPAPSAPRKVETAKTLSVAPVNSEAALAPVVAASATKAGVLGISGANWTEGGFSGVEILEVQQDSAAEIAGLHVHDVITDGNGRKIRSTADLAAVLAENGPGSKISLGYMFKSNLGWMPKDTLIILADK